MFGFTPKYVKVGKPSKRKMKWDFIKRSVINFCLTFGQFRTTAQWSLNLNYSAVVQAVEGRNWHPIVFVIVRKPEAKAHQNQLICVSRYVVSVKTSDLN